MNQILCTKLKNKSNKSFFKFQFFISVIIIVILIGFIIKYIVYLQEKENLSSNIIGNYNIYKLYADYSKNYDTNIDYYAEENETTSNIFGIIEIPKLSIYYPVFSSLNEESLKISPCKFYGNSPKIAGNICIAGHNYNNSLFFSNISLLKNGDEIFIYDNFGEKYIYNVFSVYEVDESDLSPISDYERFSKELTLITCTNLNNNRIVVKAKQNT